MKTLLVLMLLLGLVPFAEAQTTPTVSICPGITRPIRPLGYQQLAISTPAVALTVPTGSQMAFVSASGASIRWRDDGVTPTSSVGVPSAQAATIILCGNSVLNNWKAIATQGNSGVLDISYYGQ